MSFWIKKITISLWYLVASLVILAAIIGVTLQALTPVINDHKAYIEHHISTLLKMDVHIDSVKADWSRFGPQIHFKGVSLTEITAAGQVKPIFKVDDLSMQLGILGTLWHHSLYFSSLSLSGSNISIRETAKDHYLINDAFPVDLSDQSLSQPPDVLAWLITQNTIRLSHLHIDLNQINGATLSTQLDHVNVYQANKGGSHKRLSFFIEGQWIAKVQAEKHGFEKLQSQITLYTWVDLHHQKPTFLEMKLLSQNIVLQKNKTKEVYPSLEGVFLWQPVGENWFLQGKNVTLTNTMKRSEDYSFELWRFPDHYAAHLNFINTADILNIKDFFDIPAPKDFDMQVAKIHSAIEDINLQIPHDFSAIDQYHFSVIFHDFNSAAYKALPEIHHLSGAISGSLKKGTFTLLDNDDDIHFAHFFNRPVALKNLAVNGEWNHAADEWSLRVNSMNIVTPVATVQGAMQFNISSTSNRPSMFSLLAQYHLAQSQAVTTLLPMKMFDKNFTKWLTDAVGEGAGGDGKVLIRGPLNDFPYPKRQGTFIVDGSIEPLTVSFAPEWPSVDNVTGHLFIHNQKVDVSVKGSALGTTITEAHVTVPDYQTTRAVVNVDVKATGQAADYLKYVNKSPLASTLGKGLSPFTITGEGLLSLHLMLPLDQLNPEHVQVSGEWITQDTDFFWKALNMGLNNIRGAIHFTQNSVSADHVNASLGQEPLQISISSEKKKNVMTAIDINTQGYFSLKQLQTLFKIDELSIFLSGSSRYKAHLFVPMTASPYIVSFDSNLKGISIKLPQPLGKNSKTSMPLSVQATINPNTDIIDLLIHYYKNIDATVKMQHYLQTNSQQKNIQVDAHVNAFSWPLKMALPSGSSSNNSWWQSLSSITLNFSRLSVYDNNFSSVVLSGIQDNTGFIWKIHANEAQGNITLPSDPKGPITANFDYLTLAPLKGQANATSATSVQDAASWPEILLKIQRFRLGMKTLGQVVLDLLPLKNGIAFNDIQIINPLYQLGARGQWIYENKQDTVALKGAFSTRNVGELLKEMDIVKDFEAKAGSVEYNVQWLGSPMNFQLKSLEGDAKIEVRNGVIPVNGDSATMDLGKVLSLFSVQSIERRLQLNFSDLNKDGYSFNSLVTQLHFQSGKAEIKKGVFDGPAAKIAFLGRVGLVQQDYDLKLVVTPYITSTLPLIATLAGGPIAGVAAYAFDQIAQGSIAKFTAYHYLLIGPWSKPKLIDLDAQAKQQAAAKQAKLDKKNVAPVTDA